MENIAWGELPFGYFKTDYNVRTYFRDGKWGEMEISSSETINIHMAATALHYGQEAFEGLKAFRGKDGKIRLFRWKENAKRMRRSAQGIMMAEVPDDVFFKSITTAIKMNERFVPPMEQEPAYIFDLCFLVPDHKWVLNLPKSICSWFLLLPLDLILRKVLSR